MKVSFGGNHLLIFNNQRQRNTMYEIMQSNAKKQYSNAYIRPINGNKLLVVDGKEKEDIDNLINLGNNNERFYESDIPKAALMYDAINRGYADKAIIIDLRTKEMVNEYKFNTKNKGLCNGVSDDYKNLINITPDTKQPKHRIML